MKLSFKEIEKITFSIDKDKEPSLYEKFMTIWSLLKDSQYNHMVIFEGEKSRSKSGRYS